MIDFGKLGDYGGLGVVVIAINYWTRRQIFRELKLRKELENITPVASPAISPQRIKQLEDRINERIDELKYKMDGIEERTMDRLDTFNKALHALRRGDA